MYFQLHFSLRTHIWHTFYFNSSSLKYIFMLSVTLSLLNNNIVGVCGYVFVFANVASCMREYVVYVYVTKSVYVYMYCMYEHAYLCIFPQTKSD